MHEELEAAAQSIRVAGDRLDAAITKQVKKDHSLLIGERTAEELKPAIGSADPGSDEITESEVRGLSRWAPACGSGRSSRCGVRSP